MYTHHTFRCFLYMNYVFISICLLFTISSVSCLKCYLCTQEEDCKNFSLSNKNLYSKECPSNSHSCLAATKDNAVISMSCDEDFLNVCQVLEGTQFCYCTSNLCNFRSVLADDTMLTNDDEDLNEGSGFNNFVTTGSTTNKPYQATLQPLNTGNCLRSAFIIIAAAALLW